MNLVIPLVAFVSLQQVAFERPRETLVETFEAGTNVGRWSFFGNPDNPVEVIEPTGGNPGAFLHATCNDLACLDTFAPELRTQLGVGSVFTATTARRA
jgi:hypothetical protein